MVEAKIISSQDMKQEPGPEGIQTMARREEMEGVLYILDPRMQGELCMRIIMLTIYVL